MDHNSSLVNLTIPQNVTQPIVAAKIQEAVLAAMGGADKLVEGVVKTICGTMVNPKDGTVSSYSSENKISWMDFHITKLLQTSIQEELKKQVVDIASPIKEALIKELQSKKGAQKMATALLDGLVGTFSNSYTSQFDLKFETKGSRF